MRARQAGAAVIVVLAVVAVASLLVLAGLERGILSARVAGFSMERMQVFEVAEAAMAVAARDRAARAVPALQPDPGGDAARWVERLEAVGQPVSLPDASHFAGRTDVDTRVVVEALVEGYRITALAQHANKQMRVVLQTIMLDDATPRIWRHLR